MAEKLTSRQRQIRDKLAQEAARKREQQRIDSLRRRIETAKLGLASFEAKKYPEAIGYFMNYLRILEDWKQVNPGSLNPTLFDTQKDAAEMLLIANVYWNLAKIFDRGGPGKPEQQFRHFLQQFLLFSRGRSYAPLCSEPLRRHLESGMPVHKSEMKNVYKAITGAKCFIATSLIDTLGEGTLEGLWRLRDERLSKTPIGRAFIRIYYWMAPPVGALIQEMPIAIRKPISRVLDRISQVYASR